MRGTRRARFASPWHWGEASWPSGKISAALPALQGTLGDERLGSWRLEVRPLPQVLPPAARHLERAVLQASVLDRRVAAFGRDAVSLRGVPVQFREFQEVQGALRLAASGAADSAG